MTEQYAVNITNLEPGMLESFRRRLSPEKAQKVERFRFDADKVRGIIGEILVRCILISRFGIPEEKICFSAEKEGKPFLSGMEDRICFNISHAGSWVVCGIGPSRIGIDVEQIRDLKGSLARAVLSPEEYLRWESLPEEQKKPDFYRTWTIKESYSKYVGKGLGIEFRGIRVIPEGSGFSGIAGDSSCVLYSQQLTEKDILTVCVERSEREGLVKKVRVLDIPDLSAALE